MGEVVVTTTLLLSINYGLLSLLHFSWALGSKWGFRASLPTDEAGNHVLNPGKVDCVIVGAGLGFFAFFYLHLFYELDLVPASISSVVAWIIPSIFLLRVMGDFRYFGFFKKIRQTPFGRLDTHFIVPLCLLIACLGYWIALVG